MSITRSIVCGAELVWRVVKTTWPVSAAVSVVLIVGRSRFSPTMITSGSCRSALRSASAKLVVSAPTSRCVTAASPSVSRNSIGSSIVTMWTSRLAITSFMIAASVDDLPEPVGPVISTSPWRRSASSFRISGMPQSSSEGKTIGTRRKTAASVPRWKKIVPRKRDTPGTE